MCQCPTEARPCRLADRLRLAWTAFRGPAAEPAAADMTIPWDETEEEHINAVVHARHVLRSIQEGRAICSQCQHLLDETADKPLHAGWCWTCDGSWLEERIIGPMVDRIGRKATVRMLKRLVADVKAMT